MKLREVVLLSQGTSFVSNFTHPDPVCIALLLCGVGSCGTSRNGGVNTAEIVSPTRNPTNNQNMENILLLIFDNIVQYKVRLHIIVC